MLHTLTANSFFAYYSTELILITLKITVNQKWNAVLSQ